MQFVGNTSLDNFVHILMLNFVNVYLRESPLYLVEGGKMHRIALLVKQLEAHDVS